MVLVVGPALGIGDRFEVGHSLEPDPVEVLGASVPNYVSRGSKERKEDRWYSLKPDSK